MPIKDFSTLCDDLHPSFKFKVEKNEIKKAYDTAVAAICEGADFAEKFSEAVKETALINAFHVKGFKAYKKNDHYYTDVTLKSRYRGSDGRNYTKKELIAREIFCNRNTETYNSEKEDICIFIDIKIQPELTNDVPPSFDEFYNSHTFNFKFIGGCRAFVSPINKSQLVPLKPLVETGAYKVHTFDDGSWLGYCHGNIDDWAVHESSDFNFITGKELVFAQDKEYFSILAHYKDKYGIRFCNDFCKVFNLVMYYYSEDDFAKIKAISESYGEDAQHIEKLFAFLYLAMLSENLKENTVLGKIVKFVGVFQVFSGLKTVNEAANWSRGKNKDIILEECRKYGLPKTKYSRVRPDFYTTFTPQEQMSFSVVC